MKIFGSAGVVTYSGEDGGPVPATVWASLLLQRFVWEGHASFLRWAEGSAS